MLLKKRMLQIYKNKLKKQNEFKSQSPLFYIIQLISCFQIPIGLKGNFMAHENRLEKYF